MSATLGMGNVRSDLIAVAVPVFFVLIALELAIARRRGRSVYRFQDSINSLSCGVLQQVLAICFKFITFGVYALLHERFAIFLLDPGSWMVWLGALIAVDHQYYWFHRASHRINIIWATHVVHHQSEEYNLSTALRQGALQGIASAPFYWPLALIGVPPTLFVLCATLDTLYQFWIHTRLVDRLGPLEWVFNTPSHHRVHHGIEAHYLDRNYGGILIVWDRLYRTFAPEREEPTYGTVTPLASWNPLWANIKHWLWTAGLSERARGWDRVYAWWAPPEWRPAAASASAAGGGRRTRYRRRVPDPVHLFVGLSFVGVALATLWIQTQSAHASGIAVGVAIAWVIASLLSWGNLFEFGPLAEKGTGPFRVRAWWLGLEGLRSVGGIAFVALAYPTFAGMLVATLVAILSWAFAAGIYRSWKAPR